MGHVGLLPQHSVNFKLKGYKGLSPQIVSLIMSNSSQDRKIINNEIIKIKSFFTEKNISIEELEELLNIKFNRDFNEIRDASLLGDKVKVNRLLGEIQFQQDDFMFYLNNITVFYILSSINECSCSTLRGFKSYRI